VSEDRIRGAGLKVTRARIAVLQALGELGGHPTADQVLAGISATGATVSRATVFNALDDLTGAGLVVRAGAGPGAARYEITGETHHHFVCGRCGKVADVVPPDDRPLPADPGEIHGRVDDTQIVYHGVCGDCLAAEV
jgi:Fe2+ or Zn2+ uptake regulation protein